MLAPGLLRAGIQQVSPPAALAGHAAQLRPCPPGGYLLVFRPSMISLNVEDGRITAFVFSSFGQ